MPNAVVKRAFRYRFYPTDSQASELIRTFGCVRKVYNLALTARTEAWQQRGEHSNFAATSALLTEWKRSDELAFLNEVSSVPLQQALRHLQSAFVAFWDKRARYPRYKSRKKSQDSATYTRSAFRFKDGQLILAKMTEPLKIVWSRPLPDGVLPTSATVTRDSADRWFVSLVCDDAGVQPLPRTETAIGIDMGLHSLLTLSTGEKISNPAHERRSRTRLARAQRAVQRKVPGSANRRKARITLARVHARIADRRRDSLHKLTTRIVRENQTLVIEDLPVRNMIKNRHLARSISDAGWGTFRNMLEYKADWYGREVIVIDRWFPSSKLCSTCGWRNEQTSLRVRAWRCDDCGATHDRDVNAAKNILAAGRAATVCGDDVRPRRNRPARRSSVKQKTPAREGLEPLSATESGRRQP
ncbi:RNA-guided endonuclease InsQ/TnpB family protein [Nocardia sp. NPDC056100]|uniref:RNA-guided endonuclease InsQ/TnpB family protein n=1 Tax=Nocardia sp. NPDC056100 TaxID=3345712 RepID=UPI0035E1656D